MGAEKMAILLTEKAIFEFDAGRRAKNCRSITEN
jgi:hypothetical protein